MNVMKCKLHGDNVAFKALGVDDCRNNLQFKIRKCELQYVDIEILGNDPTENIKVKALIDSGTEVPVVNEKLIAGLDSQHIGCINVHCTVCYWRCCCKFSIFVCKIMAKIIELILGIV